MDKWSVVDLVSKGWTRKKIIKQVQDSGYLGENDGLWAPDKNCVQYDVEGVEVVTLWDQNYPQLLKEIDDPPVSLFYKGSTLADARVEPYQKFVAVVGSRRMSEKGKRAIENIIPKLVEQGYGIVSGLALGVDAYAHEVCLKCGGRAIAVLPTPLDNILPKTNLVLAKKILASGGTLISEYPMGTLVTRKNFLERNRIMVGLAEFLLVIEADRFSGTTASANFALDQGKDVFVAVDERGEAIGEGAKELIEDGAQPYLWL